MFLKFKWERQDRKKARIKTEWNKFAYIFAYRLMAGINISNLKGQQPIIKRSKSR